MKTEDKMWDSLKAEYLQKVQKALSSVKHPRSKDIVEDVSSHLEQRFAELEPDQRTWENFQAIITEMGPASDYAELLGTEATTAKQHTRSKYLLWGSLLAIVIIAAILLQITIPRKRPPVTPEEFRRNFPGKVAKIKSIIDTAGLEDVIGIFGKPTKYIWGKETFTKDSLPRVYIARYPNGFGVVMVGGQIDELRFEGPGAGYVFKDRLQAGSSLEEVLNVIGQPTETIQGQPSKFEDGVLYKDIDGKKGYCYYGRKDQNVRFFFLDYKVIAIYETRSDYGEGR